MTAGAAGDAVEPTPWAAWVDERLDAVRRAGRWRAPQDFDAIGPAGRLVEAERDVVSFASNDYLGLTGHPDVVAAAHAALDRWGTGSGASRLVTGSRPVHAELEGELAAWKGTERAVLFPTGFAANLGVLTTFGAAGARIVSDELNHASIIDGARLARADITICPHDDLDTLDAILGDGSVERTVVVTDSVFSMDGDAADLDGLLALCRRHRALLVLDEAHAVLGPEPGPDALDGVDVVRVGTLSKATGALGGFAATTGPFADLLVNVARSYIFTTALSPADAAAALASTRIQRGPEGDQLRDRLRRHIDRLAPGHPSPIVPIVLGDEASAVSASAALLELGYWVPAIRPPTVAPGTSRLRVTLSAGHTDDQVDGLVLALADLGCLPTDRADA